MPTLNEWIDTLTSFRTEHPSLADREVVDAKDHPVELPEINDDPELGLAVVVDVDC